MSFGEKIERYRQDILNDIATLVSIPSCASGPSGGMPYGEQSARALNWILGRAKDMGFVINNVDNYAGHVEYGEGSGLAAVLTHVDVVPAGDGWDTDPFTLTEKNGKIFGRGVSDDKAAAVISLYCLKVLKDEKIVGKRRIRTIFGAGEECGMNDMVKYFEKEEMPQMAFTPDSEYGICNREKGILQIQLSANADDTDFITEFCAGSVVNAVPDKACASVRCDHDRTLVIKDFADNSFEFVETDAGINIVCHGTASHASQPEKGVNAATKLISLLSKCFDAGKFSSMFKFINQNIKDEIYGESMGIFSEDRESGRLTLNLGVLNVSDDRLIAKVDIRYPVTEDGNNIIDVIKGVTDEHGLSLKVLNHQAPLYISEDNELISTLKRSYKAIMNEEPGVYSTGGGTYARSLKGRGVAFGPVFGGEDSRLHNSNENMDIEKLMLHAQICLEAMYNMFIN